MTYEAAVAKKDPNKTDRYLVLGLSKGSVVFVPVDDIENIYARFFFHRAAIKHIVEMPKHNKFVTICEEYNISLWGFSEENYRSEKLSFSQMYRPIDVIKCMDENIFMSF